MGAAQGHVVTPEQRDREAACKELAAASTDLCSDMETLPSPHSCLIVSWDSRCVILDRSSCHSVEVKHRAGLVRRNFDPFKQFCALQISPLLSSLI